MEPGAIGGRVEEWVTERFEGRATVSKRELMAEAAGSGLPPEAIEAMAQLPDEECAPFSVVHEIVDILETRAGGGVRGNANVPGAGGYGRTR